MNDLNEKLSDEQRDFKARLEKVLKNCTTVTQFKKVWPQAEHLLQGIEEMVNSQVIKRKRNKVEIDEETINGLNSTLLKRTLLNS